VFIGFWADREAIPPMIDALKCKVSHYCTSWNFWKILNWSEHGNSNCGFNLNFTFKYLRNESWIHVWLKITDYSAFDFSWFSFSVNMDTSLQLVPTVSIWESVTSLFHLPSLPYTQISSLLTECIVLMHSFLFYVQLPFWESVCKKRRKSKIIFG